MINYQNKIYLKSNFRYYHKEFHKNLSYYFQNKEKLDILDVGCGNGDLIFFLSKKFINSKFLGIDMDKNNIKLANKKLKLLIKKNY